MSRIVDSHVHLWPMSASNNDSHAWMNPGERLARQYSIDDYKLAAGVSDPTRIELVYVETDRRIKPGDRVQDWALEPLQEIAFLRRIVEGDASLGEGFTDRDSLLLKGIVAWAPLNKGVQGFEEYIQEAKRTAGQPTWDRVKGFRFLLQGIKDQTTFQDIVKSQEVRDILKSFGKTWSFDVGVDQRQGGVWQLEMVAELIESVSTDSKNEVFFVLSKCVSILRVYIVKH